MVIDLAFKFDELNKVYLLLGTVLVVLRIVAYLKYQNFTFLDNENEEFIINEGIFNKTKTIIQLNRIQQVNINQSLIQRLVGVMSWTSILPVALKRRRAKALSHPSL
jgi:putative membrane protein